MHGIFMGEIQALEGAGRTCWDFETGDGPDDAPFELKLDMARQCWDEARHMRDLREARGLDGHRDRRVLRVDVPLRGRLQPRSRCCASPASTGPSRAWPSTSSTPCGSSAIVAGDPVLEFCEDWMLADEVTHVKMGSRLAAPPHRDRQGPARAGPRVPAGRRQALLARRVPRRGGGQPDQARPAASASWPASTPTRSTRSPRSRARRKDTTPRRSAQRLAGAGRPA